MKAAIIIHKLKTSLDSISHSSDHLGGLGNTPTYI